MEIVARLAGAHPFHAKWPLSFSVLCLLSVLLSVSAQERPKEKRQFAVASIKPNRTGIQRLQNYAYSAGGRFTATNATLVDMIVSVYRTRRIQMQGGPDWIDSDRFDVVAKSDLDEGEVTPEQWAQMVQALLEDRFKLKLHTESREMPVLALIAGRTALKLETPKPDEKTAFLHPKPGQIVFQNMPMDGLVNYMSNMLHTPMVDRTGLKGSFDFTVDTNLISPRDGVDDRVGQESFGESLVAAVREQLGFRLEKQRASLIITIVDHADKPSEN